jgi:hypothetical protein
MIWGIPAHIFLYIHVALSLIGFVSGLIVIFGLLTGEALGGWTVLFLLALILTSVTGFPLPPLGLDPPRMIGFLSLALVAVAAAAIYAFELNGAWRWIYVVAATIALYLDAFVGVIQAFAELPFLHALAPTQTEAPFLMAQAALLIIFVLLGALAVRSFRAVPATRRRGRPGTPRN